MKLQFEALLASMSAKDKQVVLVGLDEFKLGKETRELAEADFLALARMLINQDPEAQAVVSQPCPWGYAAQLLAANIA
ncbi:hypothetical protein COT54_02120 [Candidatus Collierbacteria bacterium CG09_land_8_20_14_0_10_46_12]|uniref:Uncharacterized protein n=1 Tax=Candidatus Collierbacteria bacterium CG09_land_8_20_14_0_10_46_12 TaxID=1974533 RepID=A0A2H0WZ56_9BACT|nr:MAG: hypothetical protein COT54_02120 [Candidatus Collierbacteria bacterium CG09_land_8_20_14_0_10_46_12]